MNDKTIPFIRQYNEWAILEAGKRSAVGWRKRRYKDGTLEVPENRRYLAANSAKRNPNAPRGARFPARPSRRDRTPTSDDGRIPVLPPGPASITNPAMFPNGGMGWNPGPPFGHPTQPISGPSQLPFNGFGYFPQMPASTTPSVVPWGPVDPRGFPSSGTSAGVGYWENPPPCAYINFTCSMNPSDS
jgi:hypothetical protein